ncbi:hypothetical protein TTHERM_000035529 (macronuclear) [Tetrahymena thermophila SB210]|uniref:Uncharacterized protein n=1 Tax=Tetrahymena thermophila (strain SB210) TaxID=312017 RepID=W7XIS7_TETTS|nr:hypothetical protein TTHERM_000035529 [Tetrahymena thermophila SB210]EWS74876.1 hypothetical protein TTHERM_000035529 [Tetrahymena thermophila SB210]|eukprot:XP_012652589.1 hypothetical protein TTHERM_000035529 [Tetrahymena thermophila SB210]
MNIKWKKKPLNLLFYKQIYQYRFFIFHFSLLNQIQIRYIYILKNYQRQIQQYCTIKYNLSSQLKQQEYKEKLSQEKFYLKAKYVGKHNQISQLKKIIKEFNFLIPTPRNKIYVIQLNYHFQKVKQLIQQIPQITD